MHSLEGREWCGHCDSLSHWIGLFLTNFFPVLLSLQLNAINQFIVLFKTKAKMSTYCYCLVAIHFQWPMLLRHFYVLIFLFCLLLTLLFLLFLFLFLHIYINYEFEVNCLPVLTKYCECCAAISIDSKRISSIETMTSIHWVCMLGYIKNCGLHQEYSARLLLLQLWCQLYAFSLSERASLFRLCA